MKANFFSNLCSSLNIPEELKSLDQWVCRTNQKRPIDPHTGKPAATTNASTWGTFKEASAYNQNHDDVVGLGFVFQKENGLVGIDIDHCVENHQITDSKIRQIMDLNPSYWEYSPSGTGIHLYVKGTWPEGIGNKKKNITPGIDLEVYNTARYFTVTGKKGESAPKEIVEAPKLLQFLQEQYFNPSPCTEAALIPSKLIQRLKSMKSGKEELVLTEEDQTILDAALDSNASFQNLWEGSRPKGDESADDMALLCHLVRIFPDDPEKVEVIFRSSPHAKSKDKKHQKKMNRPDYLTRSIERAYEYVQSDYHLFSFPANDIGNAERFISLYGEHIRYSVDENQWYVYNDKFWEKDSKQYNLHKLYDQMYERMNRFVQESSDFPEKQQNKMENLVRRLGNNATRKSMISMAETRCDFSINKFNQYNDLIVAGNGIVSLKDGVLHPFASDKYITLHTDIPYHEDASEPKRFIQFMHEIFNNDESMVQYMQRLLGYFLTGETLEQKFFVFYGKGSNGKGVLFHLLQKMFGEYVKPLSGDALLKKRDEGRPNPSLVQAKDAHMVIVSETNKGVSLDEAMLKEITGQDSIMIRDMYKSTINITPHFKVAFSTNHLPNIDLSDYSMRRRYCLIPFHVIFDKEKRDTDLPNKLWNEREGIFHWIVQGAIEWYQNGLGDDPKMMNHAIESERVQSDTIYGFLKECIEKTENESDMIQTSDLYHQYDRWCKEQDINPLTQCKFSREMQDKGYKMKQCGKGRTRNFVNIKFKSQEEKNEQVEQEEQVTSEHEVTNE